jgi:cytochrome c
MARVKPYFYALAACALAVAGIFSCTGDRSASAPARGRDPWVFRSVLDLKPRIATVALRKDFWIAYDAGRASLYRVWKDGVMLDGPVYTTAHGPQPLSQGPAWLISPYEEPWRVLLGGDTLRPEVRYLGHAFTKQNQVRFRYELKLPGVGIRIEERPEYIEDEKGRPGLERIFTVENAPAGAQVLLQTHLNSLPSARSYQTDGLFTARAQTEAVIPGAQLYAVDGWLALNSDKPTRFAAWFHPEPGVQAAAAEDEGEQQHPGLALIERSDCKTCHNEAVKTIGPAYVDIAKKYKFTPLQVQNLARKVMNGGAGVWGEVAMTAHPDLKMEDAVEMVNYIMTLDGEQPQRSAAWETPSASLAAPEENPSNGLVVNVYLLDKSVDKLPQISADRKPVYSGVVPQVHALSPDDFRPLSEYFYVQAKGFLTVEKAGNYVFRLVSDDGSRLTLGGKELILNDGLHGMSPVDAEVQLEAGKHPVLLDYFQAGGGLGISLQWAAYGDDDFQVIPASAFTFDPGDRKETMEMPILEAAGQMAGVPGDGYPLAEVHPAFDLSQARPASFEPKVGGMDFLPDGRMVVSTWDPDGSVYVLDQLGQPDPEKIGVRRIAAGLAEPLGLKVVDGQIYVLQKQELTRLVDTDQDGIIDEYQTVCNGWRASANFHEFAFGLVYKEGYFYATLATAINPGGASTQPQVPDRGRVVKINPQDGSFEFIAQGLRTPNGIGIGVDGEIFVADNQGDWLPSSKIVHVQPGAFYGSRSVDFAGTASLKEMLPVVWLPQDEIGNSPSQPAALNVGPYQGQMIHGEVTHGGLKRVAAEKVNGQYQGALFRFTQGLEGGVNRVVWGPDGALYVGEIGNPGNWSHAGRKWFGLQRLKYNGNSVFEMLAVRARSNGFEIEFTEPLPVNEGFDPADYQVKQWRYQPTENYGGPKLGEQALPVRAVQVSEDRKKVFLEIGGLKAGHVVYFRLKPFVSELGHEIWSTECWYTLNQIPQNLPGFTSALRPQPAGLNQLTPHEQAQGWQLLFDGKSTQGWHAYGQQPAGGAWKAEGGALTLDVSQKQDGRIVGGGDILTDREFENYELSLEWKIAEGGNSGIIYHVIEDPSKYQSVWQTGPEMQVLDDARHPDGKIYKHRAGDLYDLIACRYVTVKAPGEWNHARLLIRDGHVEHWLNGRKVVEYELGGEAWKAMVAGSKFKDMPGFGTARKGRIALQDHGDRVWYRNIKIRELKAGI